MSVENSISTWGKYSEQENCVYVFNNSSLKNEEFLKICKLHNIKIQLDLFS